MGSAVNPEMIVVARDARGVTQSELAERIGVSQAKVSKYESGLIHVSDNDLANIARQLDFPNEFFFQTDKLYGFGSPCFYHRKRQRMPVSDLRMIQARLNVFRFQVVRLLRGVEIKTDNQFVRLDVDEHEPEECAQLVRRQWGLGMGPVGNVIATVESAGAIVYRWSFGTRQLDAISQVVPGCPPLIFVNADIPMDRLRFTLMHEVGHIIMHHLPSTDMESDADRFAAEFLMPSAETKPLLKNLSMHRLGALKSQWKVSMAALIKRAHDTGQISQRQYRSLFTKLSTNGWRTVEPIEVPNEEPTVFKDILNVHLDQHQYSITELSRLVNASEHRFRKYLDNQKDKTLRIVG